jgi:hypothetical protein
MTLLDQEGTPLKLLDIFVYAAEAKGLRLGKGVVLGIQKDWVSYTTLSHIEGRDIRSDRKAVWGRFDPNSSSLWNIKELVSKKKAGNLIKVGRWNPTVASVIQIQCPELVDIILANL